MQPARERALASPRAARALVRESTSPLTDRSRAIRLGLASCIPFTGTQGNRDVGSGSEMDDEEAHPNRNHASQQRRDGVRVMPPKPADPATHAPDPPGKHVVSRKSTRRRNSVPRRIVCPRRILLPEHPLPRLDATRDHTTNVLGMTMFSRRATWPTAREEAAFAASGRSLRLPCR